MRSLKSILEEIQEEKKLIEAKADEEEPTNEPSDSEDEDEDDDKEENISDHAPDGKGHYTADDLREIIDYVRDLIQKELKDDKNEEDGDAKEDDIGEIGLDLIYEYAELLPETVINQIVDDLKDMFEIEDTMLESIIYEGSAFFSKSKKGPAAKAAMKSMKAGIIKNINKIKKRNSKWRQSPIGKKISALHKKIFKGMGKIKGKRVVHKEGF